MGVKTIAEIKGAVRQINIGDMSIEDLENLTSVDSVNFSKRNFSEEQIEDINQRTVVNHLRNAKHIVFDRKNHVRYCEANPKVIWEKIDFTQYRNLVISTELIYRDYAELMEELDIRDGYELFYVIKSSIENWNTSLFEINCRRVPVIVMGDGSEEHQAVQLLKELSPIDFQSYYEAYEERFGVRKESAQGNPTISGILANYYTEGIYAIDVPSIDERDVAAFKEVLEIKNFWFTDELDREFERVCVNSSTDAFNSAAFKRIGYSLNMGYAYNDNETVSFVNARGKETKINPKADIVPLVVFDNASILEYEHLLRSHSSEGLTVNCISLEDFHCMCKALLSPIEIIEYIRWRHEFYKKNGSINLLITETD